MTPLRWPIMAALLLMLVPGAMLAAGLHGGPLLGVQVPAPHPALTLDAVRSGVFQHQAALWFGQRDPALPAAVALRNQVYVSVLHQSATSGVVIGRDLQLLEPATLQTYCSRPVAALPPEAEAAAIRLAVMQARYAARGKVFVYLMTPNKIGPNPHFLPEGWPCRASAAAARVTLLDQWRASLQRHGIRFVDGPAIIAGSGRTAEMYPRGGTHWNWVGASLATQALIGIVDQARPGSLAPFTFTQHNASPEGTDRDLTDLLNLPYPRLDYPAPVVDMVAAPMACRPPLIVEVGGSFTFHIDFLLARLPCPPQIALYTYYQIERASFAPFTRIAVDPARRRAELLEQADIVVLEENEDLMFHAHHSDQLWSLLQDQP